MRRGEVARYREGFLAFKDAASRPGSAAAAGRTGGGGSGTGGSGAMMDDCPLLQQLEILNDLPEEERFSAAWDIIRSHPSPHLFCCS